jgi:hypothetical protein
LPLPRLLRLIAAEIAPIQALPLPCRRVFYGRPGVDSPASPGPSELENSQPFLCKFCHMLEVAAPQPTREPVGQEAGLAQDAVRAGQGSPEATPTTLKPQATP